MLMKKKKSKPFKSLNASALGLGGLGLTVGVSGAVASQSGVPGLTAGLGTIASGAGIMTTASVGGGVLNQVRKMNKKKRRRK